MARDAEGERETDLQKSESSSSKRTGKVSNAIFYALEYAQVLRMLGNGRLEAQCFDGQRRLAIIRGKLRKKVTQDQFLLHCRSGLHRETLFCSH